MLSRALTAKPRKSLKYQTTSSCRWSKSVSVNDDFSSVVGLMEDLPLVHIHDSNMNMKKCTSTSTTTSSGTCGARPSFGEAWAHLSLKEILRGSVGVLGESQLGMTEKVVLSGGRVCVLKRFRKLSVGKVEFGKRVERFAHVSGTCKNLVPFRSYLYARRIKFVLFDYYPMGSLADLLAGSRQHGHTALDWNQRLTIVLHIARAIAFIHKQSPAQENYKSMQMNVHGNVKASNIMINTDFSACLSDYGVVQLAERVVDVQHTWQSPDCFYLGDVCQKCDVYNFGVILLDILGGPEGTSLVMAANDIKYLKEINSRIKEKEIEFFEFSLKEGREWKQASDVLDVAMACTNRQPEARPSIEHLLLYLGDV